MSKTDEKANKNSPNKEKSTESLGTYNKTRATLHSDIDDFLKGAVKEYNTTLNKMVNGFGKIMEVLKVGAVFAAAMGVFGFVSGGNTVISFTLLFYGAGLLSRLVTLTPNALLLRVENVRESYSNSDLHIRCMPCEARKGYNYIAVVTPVLFLIVPTVLVALLAGDSTMLFPVAATVLLDFAITGSVNINLRDAEKVKCSREDRLKDRDAARKRNLLKKESKSRA